MRPSIFCYCHAGHSQFSGNGPEGESLLHGFLHRLTTGLLGLSGCAVQGVANRLPGTTATLAVYPSGSALVLIGWFQRVQEYPLSLVKVAVGVIVRHGLEFRAGRVRIGRSPQGGQRRGRFLKLYGISPIPKNTLNKSGSMEG